MRFFSFVVWYDFCYDYIYILMKLEVFGIFVLKSIIVFRNVYFIEFNLSFLRLNKRFFIFIIFLIMFGFLVCIGDFWFLFFLFCFMCEVVSVNNGDKGKEFEYCVIFSIKRFD